MNCIRLSRAKPDAKPDAACRVIGGCDDFGWTRVGLGFLEALAGFRGRRQVPPSRVSPALPAAVGTQRARPRDTGWQKIGAIPVCDAATGDGRKETKRDKCG